MDNKNIKYPEMTLQERKARALVLIDQMSDFELTCLCDYLEIWPEEDADG